MTEQPMLHMTTINGHAYVKVKDLADAWRTSTSSILCTGKPNQVPAEYRKTIEGRTWCDVEGLRYRLNMMKRGGKLPGQLRQFLDRLPLLGFTLTGPLMETVHENGGTATIYRSTFQNIDVPSSEELQAALENRQIIYRYKNNRIQVLAQTLSNYLDTRTSSLLAVNKKQGVPRKFIHRQWKRTWVDLEGLKQRVAHTEHGSALLKGLNWVVQYLDGEGKPFDELVKTMKQWKSESAKSKQKKQEAKPEQHGCPAVVLASRNSRDIADLSTQLYDQSQRATDNRKRIHGLEKRVDAIEAGDRQAVQAMREKKTPFDALSRRVAGINTHLDRLDAKTEGMESRVSVLEDTSRWLSWTLAGVVGFRFVGLMLRWLRRK